MSTRPGRTALHYDAYLRPHRQSRPIRSSDGTLSNGDSAEGGPSSCEAAGRMSRAREAVAAGSVTTWTVAERIRRAEDYAAVGWA